MKPNEFLEHEVRIRVLEEMDNDIREIVKALDTKLDSHLVLIIGLLFTAIICPVILHYLKIA